MITSAGYDTRILQEFYLQRQMKDSNFELSSYMLKFSQLKTDLERINYVYSDLRKYKLFPQYLQSKKSDNDAQVRRRNGNEKFAESYYKEAMYCFTDSITYAETSEELALSFANRSACLYKLFRFEECIQDIDRAFDLNYPEILKPKLKERRVIAEKNLKKSNPQTQYHEEAPEIFPVRQHPRIPCATNCVEIKSSEEYGRHVVAKKDIKIGEVFVVERPFSTFLVTSRLQHCDFCLELCYNPVPCRSCCLVVYCGPNCEKQAFEQYHNFECVILMSLNGCGITCFEAVALRAVLKSRFQNENGRSAADDVYKSDRFKEVCSLYSGNGRFPQEKLLYFAIISSYMIYFLKNYTSFFDSLDADKYRHLIFLNLRISRLNAIAIEENDFPVVMDGTVPFFALGIYAFSSLFNHSCAPNVLKVCYGNTLVLRSVSSIKKGDQCFLSYGVTYGDVNKSVRQEFLDNYLITCRCKACEQQWDLVHYFMSYKNPVHKEVNMSEAQFVMMKVELLQNNALRAKTVLPNLRSRLKKLEDLEPWNNCAAVRNLIIKCYRIFGNKRIM